MAAVLCKPALRKAIKKLETARETVKVTMDEAQRVALRRTGYRDVRVSEESFVDPASHETIHALHHADLNWGDYAFGEDGPNLPDRSDIDEKLVKSPEKHLDLLKHIASLPDAAPELRNIRQALGSRAVERRGGSRRHEKSKGRKKR